MSKSESNKKPQFVRDGNWPNGTPKFISIDAVDAPRPPESFEIGQKLWGDEFDRARESQIRDAAARTIERAIRAYIRANQDDTPDYIVKMSKHVAEAMEADDPLGMVAAARMVPHPTTGAPIGPEVAAKLFRDEWRELLNEFETEEDDAYKARAATRFAQFNADNFQTIYSALFEQAQSAR